MSKQRIALLSIVVASLACVAFSADAVAKRRHPTPLTTYGGSTSDDAPFGLQVAKDHRHLLRLLIHATAPCPSGKQATVSESVPFAPRLPQVVTANTINGNRLPASGAFSLHGVAVQNYGERTGLVAETLTGRIHGRAAKGTFQLTVTVIDTATGQTVETCSSDTLQWKATAAPGRIFIGLTATRKPVVVALTADRLQVTDLWIAWSAPCQPDGFIVVGDHLARFAIAGGGGFGGAFDAGPYRNADGSAVSFHYDVHGAISRTLATGSLAATMTLQDASGATTATCTLAAEQWKATG